MSSNISQFIDQFEIGEEYELTINQRGHKHDIVFEVLSKSRELETVTGDIKEHEYPSDAWDNLTVRIEKNQEVHDVRGSPFGPIGLVWEFNQRTG